MKNELLDKSTRDNVKLMPDKNDYDDLPLFAGTIEIDEVYRNSVEPVVNFQNEVAVSEKNVSVHSENNAKIHFNKDTDNVHVHKNSDPHLKNADELRKSKIQIDQNESLPNLKRSEFYEEDESVRAKKSQKKVSCKRSVVNSIFFTTPEEKEILQAQAKELNLSYSNFVRLSLGLPPNSSGRKRNEPIAAFDLDLDD